MLLIVGTLLLRQVNKVLKFLRASFTLNSQLGARNWYSKFGSSGSSLFIGYVRRLRIEILKVREFESQQRILHGTFFCFEDQKEGVPSYSPLSWYSLV